MSRAQTAEKSDIKSKIKEAEACHSMGMIDEALSLYEQLLALSSADDDPDAETFRSKISQLRKEIEVR